MSLSNSPDFLLRADPLHVPPSDDCNIFDQIFDHRLYEGDDDGDGEGGPDDSPHQQDCFASETPLEDYPRLPSLSGSTSLETTHEQPSPQIWRKGLWCINYNALNVEKTRKTGVDTISAAQLVNDSRFVLQSPPSTFANPAKISTKRFVTSPNAARQLHKASSQLPLSREATLSPSPMYAQLPMQAKMQQVETWQQDFKNFTIHNTQFRSDEATSMKSNRAQIDKISYFNNATVVKNAAYQPCQIPGDHPYDEEDAEQVIDPGLIDRDDDDLIVQTHLSQVQQAAMTMATDELNQGYGLAWTTESLDSSNGSHQSSYDTLPPSLSSGISSNGMHNLVMNQNQQIWWPQDLTPATPVWSPNLREPSSNVVAPSPKRAVTHSYVENIADRTEGLGILYPDIHSTELHDPSTFYRSIEPRTPTTNAYSPKRSQPMSHGIPPVPPLPFPSPHDNILQNPSPFTTPRTTRHSPNRPNSPPLSPLSIHPHYSRRSHNRSPSRPEHTSTSTTHHRRKSIHKPGPIKAGLLIPTDDHVPTPSRTDHVSHHNLTGTSTTRAHSRSHSKPPRTPRTPKTPTSSHHHHLPPHLSSAAATSVATNPNNPGPQIDFVNFTAKDATKLLSDVAPSGSSKTRARRDAEAKERRKKLSEAALRAVSSVGGDVEALRRVFVG